MLEKYEIISFLFSKLIKYQYCIMKFQDKQNVFISFNSERTQEDKVTVDVDQTLFEATWVNPHTFMFTYKGKINNLSQQKIKILIIITVDMQIITFT